MSLTTFKNELYTNTNNKVVIPKRKLKLRTHIKEPAVGHSNKRKQAWKINREHFMKYF